ncbi:MAG: hypothetical protein H0X27_08580 [Caulobacteraceae bacterium]|nr:hypothetical protein [Caulobacteraceae bacterium]
MRVNTAKSIELGERIHETFGRWDKARQAARLRDGVYVLPVRIDGKLKAKEAPAG